jgi:hypothetical protein
MTQTYEVDVGGRTYEVDAPDEGTAWKWANAAHKEAGVKREAAIKADQEKTRADFERSEGERSYLQRAATNVGAGLDTVWEGAKQRFGKGAGDESLQEGRRLKRALAAQTTGGGLWQTAGEVLPFAALAPAAGAGLGAAAATGAAIGGLQGAAMPTLEDESVLANAGIGAAGGAAGVGLGHALGKVLPLATSAGREARRLGKAGKVIVGELGDDAGAVAARLEAPMRGAARDIPMSVAQKSRIQGALPRSQQKLAQMEMGLRGQAADEFGVLAQQQNEALYRAMGNATKDRGGVEKFIERRALATDPLREEALAKAGRWSHVGEPLEVNAATLRANSVPRSPQRELAKITEDTLGENPTPEQLYLFRKLLKDKLRGPYMPGDDVSAIVKGAEREVMSLVNAIDDRLNTAASRSGKPNVRGDMPWSKYLDEYADYSGPVQSARAQRDIFEALTPEGGPIVGNAPHVMRHKLTRAVEKFGSNKFGDKLSTGARGRLDDLTHVMQGMEEPVRSLKLGGTGGGGSQTAMQLGAGEKIAGNVVAAMAEHAVPGGGFAMRALNEAGSKAMKQELAQLMLDPPRAAQAIRAALKAGQPLNDAQLAFLTAMQTAGAGTGLGLLQQQTTQ